MLLLTKSPWAQAEHSKKENTWVLAGKVSAGNVVCPPSVVLVAKVVTWEASNSKKATCMSYSLTVVVESSSKFGAPAEVFTT